MWRFFIICSLALSSCVNAIGQEYRRNENWAIGHVPVLRFNFKDTLLITECSNLAGMSSGACISNDAGEFQFYDYGFGMADSNAQLLDNGLYTNCPKGQILADYYGQGSLFNQTSIILPKKGNRYYVFSTGMSDANANNYIGGISTEFDVLNYSVVDMDSANGKGKVIDKNHLLLENQNYVDCALHAVRHGNGKDWWLVKADCTNNRFQCFWVQEDTILGPYYQNVPSTKVGDFCTWQSEVQFSDDGSIMASSMYGSVDIVGSDTTYDFNRVDIFDFDRCIGAISYKQYYRTPFDTSSYPNRDYKEGICFSPDGNLLYMSNMYTIYQIDLQDTNRYNALFISGPDTIINQFPWYGLLKCAPNGKLYIGNQNGSRNYMSYIDKPNVKGLGCDFKANGLWQPYTNLKSPPNMPNYGLVSVSAGCWPANSNEISEASDEILVYPNPASSVLYIQSEKYKKAKKELYNSLGQLVLSTTKNELDISQLSAGLYYLRVGEFTKKVVKE